MNFEGPSNEPYEEPEAEEAEVKKREVPIEITTAIQIALVEHSGLSFEDWIDTNAKHLRDYIEDVEHTDVDDLLEEWESGNHDTVVEAFAAILEAFHQDEAA